MTKGRIVQVMGPVLDIRFKDGELPALLNAIELENNGKKLIVEVAPVSYTHLTLPTN